METEDIKGITESFEESLRSYYDESKKIESIEKKASYILGFSILAVSLLISNFNTVLSISQTSAYFMVFSFIYVYSLLFVIYGLMFLFMVFEDRLGIKTNADEFIENSLQSPKNFKKEFIDNYLLKTVLSTDELQRKSKFLIRSQRFIMIGTITALMALVAVYTIKIIPW